MSNKPLVSIGLPTYNRAATLVRAIESVLSQDYRNIELLISDNASTDDTEAICLEVARQDKRVKYLRQQTNQGAIANFREVLRRSGGGFFMWLGDDDWLDQSYVGRCMQVLTACPEYSVIYGKAKYFHEGEFVQDGVSMNLLQDKGTKRVVEYYRTVTDNGMFYGIMRRDQVREVPLRNAMAGDWFFMASVAFMGEVRTLEDVYSYRSLQGVSHSYKSIVATLGLSSFAVTYPRLSIAATAFRDILTSPVYSSCGMFGRLLLGCRVFALIERRDNFYRKRTPREIAVTTISRFLPTSIVNKIRNRRRERRAEGRSSS